MFLFIQASSYYKGRKRDGQPSKARLLVVHDMEVADGPQTAENVARIFAQPGHDASAHFCVDQNSIVQCVSVNDTAWAAPNANSDGVHVELAGFARDTRAEWLAEDTVLDNAAQVFAECTVFMRQHGINNQVRRLSLPEVFNAGGPSGYCGHIDVTNAFHTVGGHTDPGNQFPYDVLFAKVNHYVGIYTATPNWKPRFR